MSWVKAIVHDYDYVALRSGYPTRRPVQGEPPKCDKRLAGPSGSPRRPADPASPSTSSRELRCATPLLATYGDASNIETPAASASQPIWHFQRSSVPKQLRPEIRSQYSWQVSQSNWPPTDWAAGLSAAGIVKTVLRKGESCRVECGTDRRRTPGDQCQSEVRSVQLPGYALGVAGCGAGQKHQSKFADLHLVAVRQHSPVHGFTVDVRAVEATDVDNLEFAVLMLKSTVAQFLPTG